MAARLREDIHEGEHIGILIDFYRWDLTAQDFGEEIVVVVASVQAHPNPQVAGDWTLRTILSSVSRGMYFTMPAWKALRPPVTLTR